MHTEVDVPNPNGVLIPGMYAEAALTLERKNNVLAIPLQALSQENNSSAVYLADASRKIEVRPVTTGLQTSGYVEILSGAAEGDQVVISDRSGLKPGEQVRAQVIPVQQYHNEE